MDGQAMYSPPTVALFGDPLHPLRVTGFQPGYIAPKEVIRVIIEGKQSEVTKRVEDQAGNRNASSFADVFGCSDRNARKLISHPETMSANQARAFADKAGCTIGYLRGETRTPTDDAPSADLVARYYESLPPDLRKSVWAILKAAHESTIYGRFAEDNPGMIYDPLADDAPA